MDKKHLHQLPGMPARDWTEHARLKRLIEALVKAHVDAYVRGYPLGTTWRIIEANAAWCSGLYQCDPDKALDVIAACSVKRTLV